MLGVILKQIVLFLLIFALPLTGWAGPPFITDDPEPVEYRHLEVYAASQYENDNDGVRFTAPHMEINYGVMPEMQLHMIIPLLYVRPRREAAQYGMDDIELGIKYRFVVPRVPRSS